MGLVLRPENGRKTQGQVHEHPLWVLTRLRVVFAPVFWAPNLVSQSGLFSIQILGSVLRAVWAPVRVQCVCRGTRACAGHPCV